MSKIFDGKKYARKLDKHADNLTNENYHGEAGIVSDVAELLRENPNTTAEELLPLVLDKFLELGDA